MHACVGLGLSFAPKLLCCMQANITGGQANILIQPVDHALAAINVLGGFLNAKGAKLHKLPPGLHNANATYHGDGTYTPATATAALYVSPTCPLTFLSLS